LEDVAKALAKAALQAALFGQGPLASLFGGNMVGKGLLSVIPGFDTGGYTGDGGRREPKGVVHGGEYVFDKQATRRIGVRTLDAMHRQLKGYSSGGLVGGAVGMSSAASPSVQVVVIDNEEKFGQYLAANPRAEREVMSIVKRNGG
jgi:lambda family phage tail tape measure protein